MTYDPSRFGPNPALHESIERQILAAHLESDESIERQILAGDLAALLTWLRGLMSPSQWEAVSMAMSLLTGQSLEHRLSLICSAVTNLPSQELMVLLVLFRDVGADLAAGRAHRWLTPTERAALESLRDVLAAV